MVKKAKLKIVVIAVLLVFVIAVLVGFIMYNKPHTNVATTKASIETTAVSILNDFETNEVEANTKYLEQIVEVTGVITDITENKGKGIVALKSETAMGTVMCYLSETETNKLENLKLDMSVSIKGICTGYLMDVVLVKCVITN